MKESNPPLEINLVFVPEWCIYYPETPKDNREILKAGWSGTILLAHPKYPKAGFNNLDQLDIFLSARYPFVKLRCKGAPQDERSKQKSPPQESNLSYSPNPNSSSNPLNSEQWERPS